MASAQSSTFTTVVITTLTITTLTMAGNIALGNNNITGVATMSGTTLQVDGNATVDDVLKFKGTATGSQLDLTPTTGTAGLVLFGGAKGTHICFYDTDAGGFTAVDALNGSVTAHIATAGECP